MVRLFTISCLDWFKKLTIKVTNAEIYDYQTNTWANSLNVAAIPADTEKTYHIRRDWDVANVEFNLTCQTPLQRRRFV